MTTRSYSSPVRAAAAAEKRERVLQAATQFLRESDSAANFSLDMVAKLAGVTRLTVYNQFGSRRGLMEAVFDEIALRGQMGRLRHVREQADPREGLDQLIQICCEFWSSDPALQRIYDAMAPDQELAQALTARNERRRQLIASLVEKIAGKGTRAQVRRDTVDLIFALTSFAMFRQLADGRSATEVGVLIRASAHAALDRLGH
ncbi:TetR/AcrR family transcriptional regulator [Dyella sp. 2RAB6]|uniref:TetR/AcrR family transcriptional regulator n=1 Tax=Dyella sp. 2RAB6 TaxID=3232992 RepID=UPI003F909DC8